MDRDLRIRLLLEAGDRVSRPLRDIATGGSKAAQALKATRESLAGLEKAQASIGAFRSMRAGLSATTRDLGAARTRVGELRAAVEATDNPTRKMTRELAQAERAANGLVVQQRRQAAELRTTRGDLRAAGIAVGELTRHEERLGTEISDTTRRLHEQTNRFQQLEDRQRRFGDARSRFARTQNMATGMAAGGAAAIGTGVAMGTGIWRGVKAAQEYESVMTDVAQKADLSRDAAAAMGRNLLIASKAANQLPSSLQEGVETLTSFGLDPQSAVAMMAPIGRAATAYKAEIADLSAAAFAVNGNLKVPIAQTARVIDIMAKADKLGAFAIKDMAGAFPALTAGYQALGQSGTGAVADLAAALQIALKGAGDSATAANNVANIIQKISSPATIKAFSKFGIDLPNALKKAYAEGKTPLEAIAELTKKATGGDLGKIGFLFEDAQVQQGLRPLIQNMEEYRKIRAEAAGASGVTDRDFAERLKDSAEQSKQLTINAQALGIALGSLLLPTVNAITVKATALATRITDLTQRHPLLAKAVGIGALALAGLFTVLGGGAIALAGVMLPISIVNSGLVAMGVAGGIASIGLLPIIGTVALVVAGVAALAGAAYLIYRNWGAITGFFSSLWGGIRSTFSAASAGVRGTFAAMWSGVKAIFSMSLLDIYRSLAYFTGYALGSLYRFGAAALGWLTGTLPGLLRSGWTSAWSMFTGAISASWSWLTTRLPVMLANGWNAAWNAFKAAMHAAFVTVPTMFGNFGLMIVQGLWNGIKSAPGRLWSAGKALFGSLAGGFKAAAQIKSPSRVFMALGGHVIGGLDLGIARGERATVGRVTRLTRNMAAAAAAPIIGGELVTASAGVRAADRIGGLSRTIAQAVTVGAVATAAPIAAAPGARAPAAPLAPAAPVTIHIHPPAGSSSQDIAAAVRAEWEKIQRETARTRGSTMTDPPDWS